MTAAIRHRLAEGLAAILPRRKYRIISNVGTVEKLSKTLVQIELAAFEPATESPTGAHRAEVTVHVATHHSGTTPAAEDAADEAAFEVFEALRAIPWANPTRAEKTVYKDQYLGYDITTELITKRR